MKKKQKTFILFILVAFMASCNINQGNTSSNSMTLDEYNEFNKQQNEEEMIAINANFEPKLEITEEIKNTSLAELIKQEKGQLSAYDKVEKARTEKARLAYRKKWRQKMKRQFGYSEKKLDAIQSLSDLEFYQKNNRVSPLDFFYREEITYVSANSNLAKVYYLEDMGSFIKHNKEYYEKYKPNEETESVENQKHKNWDKYLQ